MPKKAYLENHLRVDELKQKYRTSRNPVEARRWHLLWKIALGWTIKKSARRVGLNYVYAKNVVKRYNELGREGVKDKRQEASPHVRGKAPLLNEEQLQKLALAMSS